MKGVCPECWQCVSIAPTGKVIKEPDSGHYFKPSCWYRLDLHKRDLLVGPLAEPIIEHVLCLLSGSLV